MRHANITKAIAAYAAHHARHAQLAEATAEHRDAKARTLADAEHAREVAQQLTTTEESPPTTQE